MAKKFENDKGFLIIEINSKEAKSLGFGLAEGCICMSCNKIIQDRIYYIAVLNDCMDRKCLDEWITNATHYKEDEKYERRYYQLYSKQLKIND